MTMTAQPDLMVEGLITDTNAAITQNYITAPQLPVGLEGIEGIFPNVRSITLDEAANYTSASEYYQEFVANGKQMPKELVAILNQYLLNSGLGFDFQLFAKFNSEWRQIIAESRLPQILETIYFDPDISDEIYIVE